MTLSSKKYFREEGVGNREEGVLLIPDPYSLKILASLLQSLQGRFLMLSFIFVAEPNKY